MPYKIRIRKKETPLIVQSETWRNKIQRHTRWIAVGIGLASALAVIYLTFWFVRHRTEERAWTLESEASLLFHELPSPLKNSAKAPDSKKTDLPDRLKKSAALYDEILKKFPHTSTAPIARYEIGNVYYAMKEYDLAEKQYQRLLDTPSQKETFLSLIHLKMGYLKQMKGDYLSAGNHFRTAYEQKSLKNRDQAGYEMGHTLETIQKRNEALKIYKEVSEAFPKSPWGIEAKARLLVLTSASPPLEETPSAIPFPAEAE